MKKVLSIAMAICVSGCTALGLQEESEFKCNVESEDLPCTSASELYRLSESDNGVSEAWKKEQKKKKALEEKKAADEKNALESPITESAVESPKPDVLLPSPEQPVAIYTPPKVARIFVAPWKDSSGALNMTSYIYMIGKEGGWSFGENGVEFVDPNLHPLQVIDQDASGSGVDGLRRSATYLTEESLREASEALGVGSQPPSFGLGGSPSMTPQQSGYNQSGYPQSGYTQPGYMQPGLTRGVGPNGVSSYNTNPRRTLR